MTDEQWFRSRGVCPACKTRDAYTIAGRYYCAECTEKINARHREQWAENRAEKNRQKREKRERAAANGTCIGCLKRPAVDGRKRCKLCLATAARRAKPYREKYKEECAAAGLCVECKSAPVIPGRVRCESCAEKNRKRNRERVARMRAEHPAGWVHPWRMPL